MKRRQMLGMLAAVGGGGALAGCGGQGLPDLGKVLLLRQSLSTVVFKRAGRISGIPITAQVVANRRDLWQRVQQGTGAALSLLGGDWLERAVATERIRPIPREWLVQHDGFGLPQAWQRLVTHDEQVWGIPWRWGVTAIGYRRDLVGIPIRDWPDLWRPELRGHLTLPDHPREVLDVVQRVSGLSDVQDPIFQESLEELHAQVLLYSSRDYIPMLRIGDAWAAVGWSEDLYQAQRVDDRIEVVLPPSGSLIWWDGWVVPKEAGGIGDPSPWLAALYQPDLAEATMVASRINSVLPITAASPGLLAPEVLARSTMPLPLPTTTQLAYLKVWQALRQGSLTG
ncbi:MAG: hypothetical protein OHK0012_07780 [Synechococcales cyanobacterium]